MEGPEASITIPRTLRKKSNSFIGLPYTVT